MKILSKINVYKAFVFILGAIIFVQHLAFPIDIGNWYFFSIAVVGVLLLNRYMIYIPPRYNALCLDTTIYLAVLYTLGISYTFLLYIVSAILLFIIEENKSQKWDRHLVNFGICMLIIGSAYYTFLLTGGEIGAFSPSYIFAYMLSMAAYFIVNIAIIALYFSIATKDPFMNVVKNISNDSFTHYLAILVFSFILLILTQSYLVFGLIIFIIMNVLVSIAFKNYFQMYEEAKKDKTYREQILNSLPVGIITSDDMLKNEYFLNTAAKDLLQVDEKGIQEHLYTNEDFWKILLSCKLYSNKKVTYKGRLLLVSQSELKNMSEQLIGRIVHFIDITEIEKMQKEMHQKEKLLLLGEMSAGAAHEIRNPLTVISGFLNLMKQGLTPEDSARFQVPLLLKELDQINNIVEEMLLLARPSDPVYEKLTIKQVLKEIPSYVGQFKDVKFKVDLDETELFIDPKQIKQVIYNVLRNSVEAMDGQGEIEIFSEIKAGMYRLFIKDNGSGIDKETQKEIFDPFFTSKDTGTGLGLTIVQRIIDDHNGKIELYETSKRGTTFVISLPIK